MNPFKLENTERLAQIVRILGDNILLSDHNKKTENMIKQFGDANGELSKRYALPTEEITAVMIIAQVLDKNDPTIEHTYNIQSGVVKMAKDGSATDVECNEDADIRGFEVPIA